MTEHQNLTLNPYHFTLVLNILMEYIQVLTLRYMFFEDVVVLFGELKRNCIRGWRQA